VDEVGTDAAAFASNTDVDPIADPSSVAETFPLPLEQARADRRTLIELCLYALDRARSNGIAERIEQGLAEVGVCAVRPDGERFDPSKHEAGAALSTDDPDIVGSIAETEIAGFDDHDGTVRVPVVTVYTSA